ncbi:DUF421 domain-containing protein (plasmid) [Lichenicola cladoniae]|uniref:DUF421 domain-containing protein n=1 Tax=Lichenicola cladoniae TaxID=1484109 RepID=A0A6M8HYJ4_9PROT|nr:YetF domain-containing protein [Lichenicola cladoniae]NPD68965.1 DUF421 domain-containing protein [Acetobacteraceae bacterium]QKE93245.1 DUF421 domain-containing protein [Lichenicola cladoniae]
MFFDSWTGLARVPMVGTLAYVALVLFIRVSGKRTLTKLNAFDLVVTVALGSTLSTVLLNNSVALAEGLLAMALLIVLQFAITWTSVRFPKVQGLVKSEPTHLLHGGRFLDDALRRERVTRSEILSVLRSNGHGDAATVAAVVLETDGSMSVLAELAEAPRIATVDVGAVADVAAASHRTD